MTIYIMLLLLTIFVGIIIFPANREVRIIGFNRKEINKQAVYCFFFATLIILTIGLRSTHVGSDTQEYYNVFSKVNLSLGVFWNNYADYLSAGFFNFFSDKNTTVLRLVFSIFKSIGFSFNGCLVVLAIIYVAPLFYLISKDSSNVWKSCFWYLVFSFSLALSGIRITIAIGLTTIAYICLRKHRRIIGIILFILAVIMHLSAIVFVLAFCLERLTVTRKSLIYVIPLFIVAPFLGHVLTPIMLKYTYYQELTTISWNLPIYIFFSATTVLIIWVSPDENVDYHKMMVIGTIICGFINYGQFGNTHRYYTQYLCICMPGLMNGLNNKIIKVLAESSYFVVGMYLFLKTFLTGLRLVPYQFFWQ